MKETLKELYQPENEVVLKELVNIFKEAEDAYFNCSMPPDQHEQYKDIILLMSRDRLNPESEYLKSMTPGNLKNYENIMKHMEARVLAITGQIKNQAKIRLLSKCIATVILEIDKLKA